MLLQPTVDIVQTIVQILGLSSIILLAYQIHSSTKWKRKFNSQKKINQKYLSSKYFELAKAGINTGLDTLNDDE